MNTKCVVGMLIVVPLLSACTPGKYRLKLMPQPGFNGGSDAKVVLDLVWTTPSNQARLTQMTAQDWFFKHAVEFRQEGLVLTDYVNHKELSHRYFQDKEKGSTTTLTPPRRDGDKVNGFVLFANYTTPDSEGRHAVQNPTVFFWFSTFEEKVALKEKSIGSIGN